MITGIFKSMKICTAGHSSSPRNQENLYQVRTGSSRTAPDHDGVIDPKNYMQPKGYLFLYHHEEKKGSALSASLQSIHLNLSDWWSYFPMSGGICKDGLNLRRVSAGHHEQESRVVTSPGGFKVPFFPLSKFTSHK